MISDTLKQFNWVDFLVIIILLRIVYIAFNSSFTLELFKLLGAVTGFYLSLHYFTYITDWITQRNPHSKAKAPLQFIDFFSFVILVIVGYILSIALRMLFERFIKMTISTTVNRSVSTVLGITRGILLASIIAFMLTISSIGYLKDSVKDSYSGKQVFNVAVNTYSWLWNNVASKFAVGESINQTVLEVQKDLNP
jgi:uncharacterized membrane protein required for colicin V production